MIGFQIRGSGRAGPEPSSPAEGGRDVGTARGPLAAWLGLILAAFGIGGVLRAVGVLPVDALPPLHAHPRLLVGPLLPAAVVAMAGIVVLQVAVRRLPWYALLAAAWLGSAVWAVTLQLPDGIARPLTAPTEYLAGLPAMGDHPLAWLRGFTRHLQEYPTHVKGHPPLPMLILWTMRWAGLSGATWAATLLITVGSSAAAAIALTVRTVVSEESARRAVPFLVLAPTALWVATSMDALFLGVAAWGVALLAVAASRPRGPDRLPPEPMPRSSRPADSGGRRGHWGWVVISYVRIAHRCRWAAPPVGWAFTAGLLLGSLPYLSYGLLSFYVLPLSVLILTRPGRTVGLALVAGCLVVPIAFALAGFSWWDGAIATHAAWAAGAGATERPYAYFLVGDLAVLALVIGPAAGCALPYLLKTAAARIPRIQRWSPRSGWVSAGSVIERGRGAGPAAGSLGVLVGAALVGVLALDLSGVTRGEVERIWLPYAAWMAAGAAVHESRVRALLVAQAATALLLQALVRSPW